MLKRKFLAFFFSSLISVLLITIGWGWSLGAEIPFDSPISMISFIGFISLFVVPVNFIYGFPLSIQSDKITECFSGINHILLALIIHLFFGIAFGFIAGLLIHPSEYLLKHFYDFLESVQIFFIASIVTSILFWLADEMLRLVSQKKITD